MLVKHWETLELGQRGGVRVTGCNIHGAHSLIFFFFGILIAGSPPL